MAKKRALLVGIDEYPNPLNRLNSCVADSLAFRDMLTSLHGFNTSDITLLHNQAATLVAVTSALQDLLTGVNEGDEIVFFESSHGWQHPVGSTMVEVLCLYDDFLTDTELVNLSKAAPSNTLTVTLDSCHSGGMYKLFFANGMAIPAKIKMFTPTPSRPPEWLASCPRLALSSTSAASLHLPLILPRSHRTSRRRRISSISRPSRIFRRWN